MSRLASRRGSTILIRAYFILPALGSRRLDQIGVREIEGLKTRLAGQGLKPKTVNNVLAVLGKLLSHAVELEVLDKKPRIRLLRIPPQRYDFLTFEEYDRLIEVLPSEPLWGSAILAAGDAGLRVGEVRGLFWEDVDLAAGVITVRRSMWRDRMGSPKGGRERKVPMTARLSEALRGARHLRGDHVWCQDDGRPLTINQAEFAIQRVCRRAGLRKIGWHVLRHGFCSHLAMAGAAPKAIQELAGHRSITTTMRYMHLAPSALHEAIGLLDRRLDGASLLHGRGTYVAPRKG
jgi:integrase